jgi:type IV secretory pathway VirB2 component (pilin)
MYIPTPSLSDPPVGSPIADGVIWVQGVAFGLTATAIAILAVAAVGLLMLSGRIELRRGITVVLGGFILFGASSIAAVLTGLTESGERRRLPINADFTPLPSPLQAPTPPASAYDPYAGASVPTVR